MTTDDDNKASDDQTTINTGGGNYINSSGGDIAGRDVDKRQGENFVDGDVYGNIIREQHNYYQPTVIPPDNQQQRILEANHRQDTALQAYLDQMTQLLLQGKLRTSRPNDEVRVIARMRTLTMLRVLDGSRKATVLLRGAHLEEAHLEGANLNGAPARGVPARGAPGGSRSGARVPGENRLGQGTPERSTS